MKKQEAQKELDELKAKYKELKAHKESLKTNIEALKLNYKEKKKELKEIIDAPEGRFRAEFNETYESVTEKGQINTIIDDKSNNTAYTRTEGEYEAIKSQLEQKRKIIESCDDELIA